MKVTKEIPVSEIDFGTRYREDYGDIKELAESMNKLGQIHPIVVLTSKAAAASEELFGTMKDPMNNKYLLVAGGRRTTAVKSEFYDGDTIRAEIWHEPMSERDFREIELEENIRRKDLTWQEQVASKKALYDLKVEKHGEKKPGPNQNKGVSKKDVAEAVNEHPRTFSRDVKLAEALEKIPALKNAKNPAEARKILKKLKKQDDRARKVKQAKAKKDNTPQGIRKKELLQAYRVGDMLELVKDVQDNTIDLVEFDPPYAIDLDNLKKNADKSLVTLDYHEIEDFDYKSFMKQAFEEAYRIMKRNSWMIVWFGPEPWFEPIYQWIRAAGKPEGMPDEQWFDHPESFKLRRIPGIWWRTGGAQLNQPDKYFAHCYDMFFYVRKGSPGIQKQGRGDVFNTRPVYYKNKTHPTQRPVRLYREIFECLVAPDSLICSLCAGSGAPILGADLAHMKAFGFDLSKEFYEAYAERVLDGKPGEWSDRNR